MQIVKYVYWEDDGAWLGSKSIRITGHKAKLSMI
jgi:hypothetical protein